MGIDAAVSARKASQSGVAGGQVSVMTAKGRAMRCVYFSLAISLVLVPACLAQKNVARGPVVHLMDGRVEGKMNGSIAVFEGIPFA